LAFLSFLVAALFVPGLSGAATTPRWALLSIVVPFLLPKRVVLTPGHWAVFLLLLWCACSLTWTADPYGGTRSLWHLVLFAGLFCAGAAMTTLRPVYIGMALGLGLSSAAAIAQYGFGWNGVDQYNMPGGLFINPNFMAEVACLVLVALVAERLWLYVPLVLPAALLPQARGALLGLICALVLWTRNRLVMGLAVAGLIGGVLWTFQGGHRIASVQERFAIWRDAAEQLRPFGNGIGSFYLLYPASAKRTDTLHQRPDHAHNDYLEAAFELGIGAGLLFAVWGFALALGRDRTAALVLTAFLVMAVFGFPLHMPASMFLVALVAGRLCGSGASVGGLEALRRSVLRPRHEAWAH
jgi:O-antigen ligase